MYVSPVSYLCRLPLTVHRMSLEPYYYRPATPPEASLAVDQSNSAHSRNTSCSSWFSADSSPESALSGLPTPSRSPIRHHGPTLLPKIRSQDTIVEPSAAGGPKRTHRRVLSNTRNPPAFSPYPTSRPGMQRSVTEPVTCHGLLSPMANSLSRGTSLLNSPITLTPSHSRKSSLCHSRGNSTSSIDETLIKKFGYPTYRQLPTYVAHNSQPPSPPLFDSVDISYELQSTVGASESAQDNAGFETSVDFMPSVEDETMYPRISVSPPPPPVQAVSTINLLDYLTEPTQPINLVRQVNMAPGRGLHNFFWWDIRNLRSWDSFCVDTISTIPGLFPLLTTPVDCGLFPITPPANKTVTPDSEAVLTDMVNQIYSPKVNAAVALSQGMTSLSLYPVPREERTNNGPHLLANYPHDNERTIAGGPRGRVVGLVKSFDQWNTGMRNEVPYQKVRYLNGLAHLQKCMRDHSCRYGFIITEIELVCVRAGCDEGNNVPYFGYLEVSEAIPTKAAMKPAVDPVSASSAGNSPEPQEVPLTVSLALYYLLMLSKSTPLPGQPGSFMDVGGPGALTRQRLWMGQDLEEEERGKDGKDKWIPEPQMGEKRDAKRVRGWVFPNEPWHKREGSSVGRRGGRS